MDTKPARKAAPRAAKSTAPRADTAAAPGSLGVTGSPIANDAPEAVAAMSAPPKTLKDILMTNETVAKAFEAAVPAMEKSAADMVAKTQAAQEQMAEKLKEMMEKNMKTVTEMTDFAKGNVEAMIESAKAAAAGAETLTSHFVETSKKSVEEAQAAFKAMTTAKTPNDMIAAQNEFAKAQFDKAVANMSHFSETWMKLAGEVVQPLSNRMALAGEQVKKTVSL